MPRAGANDPVQNETQNREHYSGPDRHAAKAHHGLDAAGATGSRILSCGLIAHQPVSLTDRVGASVLVILAYLPALDPAYTFHRLVHTRVRLVCGKIGCRLVPSGIQSMAFGWRSA